MSAPHADAYFHRQTRFWDDLYGGGSVYSEIHRLRLETALRWIDELALPPGARVLELGCGAGWAAVALAQRGFRVQATDSVAAMLERARHNATAAGVGDRVAFEVADAHAVGLPDDSADLVLALGVIPWVASPERVLSEMARLAGEGGAVLLNADNAARLHYALDPRYNPRLAPTRAQVKAWLEQPVRGSGPRSELHSLAEFDRMLAAAGLTKVRAQTIGFGPFTVLGRPVVPDRAGVRLHRSLQRLADNGVAVLAARGAQYLVLARSRGRGSPRATA